MITSSTVGGVFRCSAIAQRKNGDKAERGFPEFLPVEIERVRDRATRRMAQRIERIPVKVFSLSLSVFPFFSRCKLEKWRWEKKRRLRILALKVD